MATINIFLMGVVLTIFLINITIFAIDLFRLKKEYKKLCDIQNKLT